MSADQLFKAGRLREAIAAQTLEVKAQPADAAKRLFLFELLVFDGDLERARKQIDAIQYEETDLQLAVATYHGLLSAETHRRELFRGGLPPKFLADPPAHVHDRLAALACLRAGDLAQAAVLLQEANAGLPEIRGTLNGRAFEGLRDADDRFGTVLEVMARGDYYWVPLEQVELLAMGPPRFPRDLLWFPARLELEGGASNVFVPTFYPFSHDHPDESVRLGRLTDWTAPAAGPPLAPGPHMFLAGEDPIGILEWRELVIDRGDGSQADHGP